MAHKRKKNLNNQRHEFLRTFFNGDYYAFQEVNGFILEQRLNGNTNKWEVGIYTKDSWRLRESYKEKQGQIGHLLDI